MRTNAVITEKWLSGKYFGDNRSHGRVTVQLPWADIGSNPENVIFETFQNLGVMQTRGNPVRWFQRSDNSQIELEVPNVKSIEIDRSIDQDAATCTITIYNQWMYDNDSIPSNTTVAGQPGYFTPHRGDSPEAVARWGTVANAWNTLLVPNAIIRTRQGYGGNSKTIQQAETDGNIVLTGVWLVDTVDITHDGNLQLSCRDMSKLLLVQQLYPPLVPQDKYPLRYFRYYTQDFQISATSGVYTSSNPATGDPTLEPGFRNTTYVDSDVERWFGPGASVDGHSPLDAVDGTDATYYLSYGYDSADAPYATTWIEFTVDDWMNGIYLDPWQGGYTVYISVMENGEWQGDQLVPYDYRTLVGRVTPVIDVEANIPYVAMYPVPVENDREYILPRMYNAERFRVSFRHLFNSGVGTWTYRAGVRQVRAIVTQGAGNLAVQQSPGQEIAPIFYAADSMRKLDDLNKTGYITVSNFGHVDAFGDCRLGFPTRADDNDVETLLRQTVPTFEVSSVALTPTGDGYWVLYDHGPVRSFGTAEYYGDASGQFIYEGGLPGGGINKAATIIATPSGLGYWIITWAGQIFNYGDAEAYDDITPPTGEFFHGAAPFHGEQGLFLVATNGMVYTRGAADFNWLGNYNESSPLTNTEQAEGFADIAIDIESTLNNDGYWILTSSGRVQAFGAAQDFGEFPTPVDNKSSYERFYQILPSPDDRGYLMLDGDGMITGYGDVEYFGSPKPGMIGQLRFDGNYLDYTEIVKDLLLWSGFTLKEPDGSVGQNEFPTVYGALESTGSFSKSDLPDEMFDKKPVMDAINELKETVGYICFCDDEGRFRFHSPNWWQRGNFDFDGTYVNTVPEIDERVNLITYSAQLGDEDVRSLIILSSSDPDQAGEDTITTRYTPQNAPALRGLHVPAMWVNEAFRSHEFQLIMAELIALHTFFSQRLGRAECAANPLIGVDDQVRIFERTTGESWIHYVRSVHTSHDLDTGDYRMQLTTHWLGEGDYWPVTTDTARASDPQYFVLSLDLQRFLLNSESSRIRQTFQAGEG